MKRNILFVLLLSFVMMSAGCGEVIIPCLDNDDCAFDLIGHIGGMIGMECNLDKTPQEKCEEMQLPFDIPFLDLGPDCDELPDEGGVCELDIGFPF